MKRHANIVLISIVLVAAGCSTTRVNTPLGEYMSTRDSDLQGFELRIEEHPDGTKITTVKLEGASGQASPVIQAQTAVIEAAVSAAVNAGVSSANPLH